MVKVVVRGVGSGKGNVEAGTEDDIGEEEEAPLQLHSISLSRLSKMRLRLGS